MEKQPIIKETQLITKGYKVTDSGMKCRGYQYELGKRFKQSGKLELCEKGFHFCQIANDCFNYYDFVTTNRVFEIISYGEIVTNGDKCCTYEIEFIRELTWLEVLTLVNLGKDNTGRSNSGNWNSGNWNSGNSNSGDCNSGNSNSGDCNSGNRNSGNWNSGNRNSGNWNSGNCNSGNWNSGNCNSGDCNSGNSNSGNWNSGNWNSGNRNSGNWNSGNCNSGDCNSGYRNSGAFCINPNPYLILFDKPTKILVKDWERSEACQIMNNLNPTIWVYSSEMTNKEKKEFPTHETTGGYLKNIPYKEAWANLWGNLTDAKKKVFTDLENFDSAIFQEITGIKI